jgi:hypothetical protein
MNTADFLGETDPGCTVFVIGEGGLLAALHEHKIASDSIRPRYVVVGEGTTTMDRLTKAHECIERGARLLATNPDNWCPVSSDKTRPGAGATAAFLEASTGHNSRTWPITFINPRESSKAWAKEIARVWVSTASGWETGRVHTDSGRHNDGDQLGEAIGVPS